MLTRTNFKKQDLKRADASIFQNTSDISNEEKEISKEDMILLLNLKLDTSYPKCFDAYYKLLNNMNEINSNCKEIERFDTGQTNNYSVSNKLKNNIYHKPDRTGKIKNYYEDHLVKDFDDSVKISKNKHMVKSYCKKPKDFRTIKPPNGKGASVLIHSLRRDKDNIKRPTDKICFLLGKEKYGKYQGLFNLFGGHFESEGDKKDLNERGLPDLHLTVKRELSEEFSEKILEWINWCGSPWAFNQTYIEFAWIHYKFDINLSFRENDEMSEAQWFPIDNIFKAVKSGGNKSYLVEDIDGNIRDVSLYAHGVITAAKVNEHFKLH